MTLRPPATRKTPPSTSRAAVETHKAAAASRGSVSMDELNVTVPLRGRSHASVRRSEYLASRGRRRSYG